MPPLRPGTRPQAAAGPQQQSAPMPSKMQLAGMQQASPTPSPMGQTAGMSQISDSAVRMGAEIDQALKLLAQAMPQLAPWVEQVCLQLRYQIGSALNSGGVPTNPTPEADNTRFPDGGGRM